jgi:transposase
LHVIGEDRSERLDALSGDRHPAAKVRLPRLPGRGGAGAGAVAADRGRPADRADGGARAGDEVCGSCAALSSGADAGPAGIIDRSTLAAWVGTAAAERKPLWRLLRDQLLGSAKLFVDETTAPVLDPGRGRTKTGYFWAIARDDRPWGGADPPAVVYSYAPGRGNEHAAALLKDFHGILQTDAYVAYKKVAKPPVSEAETGDGVILAHCWHIADGGSSRSLRRGRRRSPAKRCSGSRRFTRSRRRSAAGVPKSGGLSDSGGQSRSWTRCGCGSSSAGPSCRASRRWPKRSAIR